MTALSKSLLTQILNPLPEKEKTKMTETRGSHAIAAGINFINLLKENYSQEESEALIKRFVNAIRTEDPKKFFRGIHHIQEKIESEINPQ